MRPPNWTMSPGFLPGTGMRRVAVVLLLIIPIAASSARIAERVDALVSPGTAIISRPTEQTQVMASSFSRQRLPLWTASIMPRSSLTGMKAPESPPTLEEAMRPPFLTASLRSARAAVVPGPPQLSRPISSRTAATLSPTAEVGASERSMMPKGAWRRSVAASATSWPRRVIMNAVFLIVLATTSKGAPFTSSSARFTTPGPETPTWIAVSPCVTP